MTQIIQRGSLDFLSPADALPTRTMNCQRCSRTRCRRRCASGSPRLSPDSWARRGGAPTRSRNSARSPMPFARAYSSTASTGGSPTRPSCNFHRTSLRFSRYDCRARPTRASIYATLLVCVGSAMEMSEKIETAYTYIRYARGSGPDFRFC